MRGAPEKPNGAEPGPPAPALRFWMAGPELGKLAKAAQAWFARLGEWAIWPARQLEALTCSLPVLNLLAWERNIRRYPNEPERLFRRRVKYAYANGRDAGGLAGWKRIFQRLELPPVELEERAPGQAWDVVNVVLDDADMPDSQNVLEIIINDYGRTCRRYRFVSRIRLGAGPRLATFDNEHCTLAARPAERNLAAAGASLAAFGHEQATATARHFKE